MNNVLSNIYDADPHKRRVLRRYSSGITLAVTGTMVTIDVGAVLPDGSAVTMTIPIASGFRPAVGQVVAIAYMNDDVNAPYAVAVGDSASISALDTNRTGIIVPFFVNAVSENEVAATKLAMSKNMFARALIVTGITVAARAVVGAPLVYVYAASAPIATAVTLSAAGTLYTPTITTPSIAANTEISIRAITAAGESISELTAHLWGSAPLP